MKRAETTARTRLGRQTSAALVALSASACLLAGTVALGDGGEDEASSDDLLCVFRAYYAKSGGNKWDKSSMAVPWTDWWYANRRNLLVPTPRRASEGATDDAARARALDVLREELGSKDRLAASEAALALGRAGDPEDIPRLATIVEDDDVPASRRLHKYAALGLGMLPPGDDAQAARARSALMGALTDAKGGGDAFSYFWTYCAYALAMRGDDRVLPDLVALHAASARGRRTRERTYPEVAGAVCYAMAVLGGEMLLPEVREHLVHQRKGDGGTNDTSWAATQALARVPCDASRAALREAAEDDRWMVRAGALQGLGATAVAGDDETAALLRTALADDDEIACRRMAAIALGRQGHATAKATLLEALEDGRVEVRPFAGIGLGLLLRAAPDPALAPKLARALGKASGDHDRGSLALACGLARVADAAPDLIELVERGTGEAGPLGAWALGEIGGGGPAGVAALHAAAAQSSNALLRREAALALGTIGDAEIVGRPRAVVASRATDMDRAQAAVCLGRIGSDRDADVLLAVLADRRTSDPLRPCIVHALGWLLDRSDHAALSRITADVKWDKHVSGVSISWTGEALWDLQHLVD